MRKSAVSILLFALLCALLPTPRVQETFFPMTPFTVAVDAGHGGWDPGKTGQVGAHEKDINLAIALYLAEYLKAAGVEVLLTREEDRALSPKKGEDLKARLQAAEGADILISIHQNAYAADPRVCGAQTFYVGQGEGKVLAERVMERLRQELDPQNHRVAKQEGQYYLLTKTDRPAIIAECGFLTCPREAALLNDETYQKQVAHALCLGILDYLFAL